MQPVAAEDVHPRGPVSYFGENHDGWFCSSRGALVEPTAADSKQGVCLTQWESGADISLPSRGSSLSSSEESSDVGALSGRAVVQVREGRAQADPSDVRFKFQRDAGPFWCIVGLFGAGFEWWRRFDSQTLQDRWCWWVQARNQFVTHQWDRRLKVWSQGIQ